MTGDAGELLAQVALCDAGAFQGLGDGANLVLGGVDGVMVVASPATAAGFVQAGLATRQGSFGFESSPDDCGELGTGLVPLLGPVRGDGGVELAHPGECGGAGVSEFVDAKGESVIDANTGCDHLSPMVVELLVESADVVSPPSLSLLESLEGTLVSLEGSYPGGNVVSSVPSLLGPLTVNSELLLQLAAFMATASAQTSKCAMVFELADRGGGNGVHIGQPSLRRL
jgi:hypothetical protein